MRYAVFSDVHGNIEALEAILAEFEGRGVDRWYCLGDIVGYGAEPEACCTRIRELADVTLLGNHDAAVAGRMDYSYYYDAAREALDWCRERLSPENLAWLTGLPYTHRADDDVELSHGSPYKPQEYDYVFCAEQAHDLLRAKPDLAPITFIGHSHLTRAFAVSDDEALDVVAPRFSLKDGFRYVVTVGSVGQPRDYDPRACAGLYDTEARTFEYVRVEYDVESQRQKILDAGLAQNFGTRLLLGI